VITLFTGCTLKSREDDKLNIVTTIFPYYDFVRAIAGEDNVSMLIPPGMEVHSYDLKPEDIIKIEQADIFVYTGGESDTWVNDIISDIDRNKTKIVRMMDYIDVVKEKKIEGSTDDETSKEYDEHIWTSPKNAIVMINKLNEIISNVDKKNSDLYAHKAMSYIKDITDIDEQIKDIVNNSNNKMLIFGDRFPFRYFTDEFDLKYSAAFPGCSAESEPSVSTLTYLIDKIKDYHIPLVLYIELRNHKVADTLSLETGIPIKQLHSIHNVTKEDFNKGVTYVSLMKENIKTLKIALQ
jgi:zinc transport system substrate-binding protein